MAILWTKKFSSTDDGAVLDGADLGTMQDDISSAVSGDNAWTQGTTVTKTADYAAVSLDAGKIIIMNKATAITLTLPDISGDEVFHIKNIGLGAVTITPDASDTTEVGTLTTGQSVSLVGNGSTNTWLSVVSLAEGATDAGITFSDITTNNSSTTKHGFLRKLSNVATEFMNGVGNWVAITIDSILPSQTGNSGKFLTTNGSAASWGTVGTPYTAGSSLEASSDGEVSFSNGSYQRVKGFSAMHRGGTVTISFDLHGYNGAKFGKGRVYVNSTAVGTERTVSLSTYSTFTEDISFSAGDTINLYCYGDGGGSYPGFTRNFRMYTGSPTLPQAI